METVIVELANYLILLLTILYTYLGFLAFRKGKEKQKRIFRGQYCLLLIIHLVCFSLLYMQDNDLRLIGIYLVQLVVLTVSMLVYRKIYESLSMNLFLHMQFFLVCGYVFVTRLSFESGVKQTIFSGVALLICLFVPILVTKLHMLERMHWLYALIGISLLTWVLIAGTEIYGATNWVKIFDIGIQPSEFVKLIYVFMLASFLSKRQDIKQVIVVSLFAAIHVLLLVAERDLGGALIFYVTYVIVLYAATKKIWLLVCGTGGGILASIVAYSLFSHIQVRVLAWKDPWSYIEKEGYQVAQSLFGIGTGGWFGMGLGKGLPKSIPVVTSDFIFSGISEEFGGFFAICLILIYFCTLFLFVKLAVKIKSRFGQYIAIGYCVMFAVQVFLCIGGAIKLIPSTGVTLPLISYGGSSMVSSIVMFSLIQGLYVFEGSVKGGIHSRNSKELVKWHQDKTVFLIYGMMFMFSCLILYFVYFIGIESKAVINNSYNKRQDLFARETLRGEILASDGTVLAYSVEEEAKRIYPYKNVYSHFVGRELNGKTGIEAMMNFDLLSSHDNEWKKMSEKLRGEKNLGDRVVTTVVPELQIEADRALSGLQGAVVLLEPSTGKILAMVSKPDYDPNRVAEDWISLTEDKENEARLLNRASSGMYPPGSTFKVLTALEYMLEYPEWEQEIYHCTGSFQEEEYKIQCNQKKAHGTVTLQDAFALSCNTFFASHGLCLSRASFRQLAEHMLFNQELPVNFPHKASSFSLGEESNTDEIMQTMIGQGKTQISPLHNAMLASAVANGGVLMRPFAVERVETWDGKVVKKYWPESYGSIVSVDQSEILTKLMSDVVNKGTARSLQGLDISVYGKTGTAEYVTESGEKSAHSWFMGFAENSQGKNENKIALAVILEGETRGKKTATEVTKKILQAWKLIE